MTLSPEQLNQFADDAKNLHTKEEDSLAIKSYQQVIAAAKASGNLRDTAIAQANLGAALGEKKRYNEAREILEQAKFTFAEIGDRRGECQATISLATAYFELKQLNHAISTWQVALDLARQLFDYELAAIALRGLAYATEELGDISEAHQAYQKLLSFYQKIGDRDEETDILLKLAKIELELGNTSQAEVHGQRALRLAHSQQDVSVEAYCLYRLGKLYSHTGFNEEARSLLNQSVEIYRKQNDQEKLGLALNHLAIAYSNLGLYQEGLDAYQQSLKISEEEIGDEVDQGGSLHGIGFIYHQIGRYQDALDYYHRALRLTDKDDNWHLAAQTHTNLGASYYELGQHDKALEYLQRARDMQNKANDPLSEGRTLNSIGAIYYKQGMLDKALEAYQEALAIQRKTGDRDAQSATLINLGEIRFGEGQFRQALDHITQAFELFKKVTNPVGQIKSLYFIARIHDQAGELSSCASALEEAIQIIERMRSQLISEDMRTSYFATIQYIYARYIEVLLAQNRPDEAFVMAERSKARSFLELLNETQPGSQEDLLDTDLQEEENSLLKQMYKTRQQLDDLSSQAKDKQDGDKILALEANLQDLERQYQINLAEIRRRNPRTQPEIWDVERVQGKLLDGQTALLEYVLGEQVSTLFVVLKNNFEVFRLPPRAEIEQKVLELRAAFIQDPPLHRYPHGDLLYNYLIQPAAHLLQGKELLIVADGALHYLPFSILLTSPPETRETSSASIPTRLRSQSDDMENDILIRKVWKEMYEFPAFDFANLPYLIHLHSIRYAPSASIAGKLVHDQATHHEPADNEMQIAALAVPFLPDQEPLENAVPEIWALAELFDRNLPSEKPDYYASQRVVLFTGPQATKKRILKLTDGSHSYRFLHIATHGLLNMEKPQFSGLLFTPEGEQDSRWQTLEIFNAKIPAEMVVLSVCQTGLGKLVRGEGVIGLTRAFFYAGVSRVCVSLWTVKDMSTPDLMKDFYQNLLCGKRGASALRAAQLNMLKAGTYTHPFFWAPFVVIGLD